MPESMRGETLQQQLDAFLAYAEGDVLLWHDPAGAYASVLAALYLPADVALAREDASAPFGLKVLVGGVDVDERLLVYRRRYRDVEAGDWLADVEARADWFAPTADAVLPGVPAHKATVAGEAGPLVSGDAPAEAPSALEARGARSVPVAFPTESAYFDSLFQAGLVSRDDIPTEVLDRQSFKVFLSRRAMAGRILPYEQGSWVTRAGLDEMGIAPADLAAFAKDAIKMARGAGMPCFTVPSLRGLCGDAGSSASPRAAGPSLLAYGFSDAFYVAVLTGQSNLLASAKLCGVRVFCPAGTSPRGRDVIEAIVRDAGSMHVDELVRLLQRTYGIPISRNQLLTLAKKTDLYLYRGVDKLYPSYEQFLREVE